MSRLELRIVRGKPDAAEIAALVAALAMVPGARQAGERPASDGAETGIGWSDGPGVSWRSPPERAR